MRYFAIVVLLCAVTAICQAEERWALLVGIDEYFNEGITPLKGAVRDAQALRDMLVKYARFPPENIFTLTSDDRANIPNLGNIVTKLDYIASKARPGDLFLFFFAGHGIFMEDENYLLAYESDVRPLLLPKTGLSVEELNAYLSKIQSGNTILILDACRNSPGAGRGDEDNRLTGSLVKKLGLAPKSQERENIEFRASIYASDIGQRAYEWPGKDRGFFSLTLEEALSGKADSDSNGETTLNEVALYLGDRVPDLVSRELGGGKKQTPRVDISGDPRAGSIVLAWSAGVRSSLTARELKTKESQQPLEPNVEVTDSDARTETQGRDLTAPAWQGRTEHWVDATGVFFGADITQEEAQQNAMVRARRSAVEMALGGEERIQEFLTRSASLQDFHQAFIALNQSDVYGRIVEESEPVWAPVEKIEVRAGRPPVPLYSVNLRAKVARERSQPLPGFSVSIKLHNKKFRLGEEMVISSTPSQDCYITIFNVLPDHTVIVISTPQKRASVVSGGQPFFASTEVAYRSDNYPGSPSPANETESVGSVLVIATKENIPFLLGEGASNMLLTYESALEAINNWLVNIPLAERAFDIHEYQIERK
ncbi:caspase family protein [Candidatus Poribacteria bacterium]